MSPLKSYPESVAAIICTVDHNFHGFLSCPTTRRSLQLHCASKLTIPNSRFFEFFDHYILSNLYWGIETIESAINSNSASEQNMLLANSEKMLQVPAILDEDSANAGIDNKFIVCCSYLHLAFITKLWSDEWQMAMHFLQDVLVSSSFVGTELAPELYASLFGSSATNVDEVAARQQARRYKDCLMFYQVICYGQSRTNQFGVFSSCKFIESDEQEPTLAILNGVNKADQSDSSYDMGRKNTMATVPNSVECDSTKFDNRRANSINSYESFDTNIRDSIDIKRLQEMLEESQSDSSVSIRSDFDEFLNQVRIQNGSPGNGILDNEQLSVSDITERNCSPKIPALICNLTCEAEGPFSASPVEDNETNATHLLSYRTNSSRTDRRFSTTHSKVVDSNSYYDYHSEEKLLRSSPKHDFRCFRSFSSKFRKKYDISELIRHGNFAQKEKFSISQKDWSGESSNYENSRHIQLLQGFEKVISALCTSDGSANYEDVNWEMNTMWDMLHNKHEHKYSSAKHEMLQQLFKILSSSKRESEISVSVSILLCLIAVDNTIIDDIKRENFNLYNLATALKRNVHEATSLIYLFSPSPSEIRSLELLSDLVEVACNAKREEMRSLSVTPTKAAIAMIEILVTAFDYVTNNMHLEAISSPQFLTKLVNVAMNNNTISEGVAVATILMKCMRLNGNCRKFLSQVNPIDPFVRLLGSSKMSAKSAALEYFHELLCMPRSSAIRLLYQIRQVKRNSIKPILLACVKQVKNENQLMAANILLQLEILEGTKCRSVFAEEAIGALLDSVMKGENPRLQSLSLFILSNIGGTFSWTGVSYTAAWLVNKAGLKDSTLRNMIRDIDWHDPCLQDPEMCSWSRKAAKVLIKSGRSVFCALTKVIHSERRRVQRDWLITTAWLGSEMHLFGQGASSSLLVKFCWMK